MNKIFWKSEGFKSKQDYCTCRLHYYHHLIQPNRSSLRSIYKIVHHQAVIHTCGFASLDVQSLGHMCGISLTLEVVNSSTALNVPYAISKDVRYVLIYCAAYVLQFAWVLWSWNFAGCHFWKFEKYILWKCNSELQYRKSIYYMYLAHDYESMYKCSR